MAAAKGSIPWNAGTSKGWIDKRGYRWIYVTENGKRRAKREHRHVVEKAIGRALRPDELVHHDNGNLSDNRIENLTIQTWEHHNNHHHIGAQRPDAMKKTAQVLANYREDNKRLKEINAELLEALKIGLASLERHCQFTQFDDDFFTTVTMEAAIAAATQEAN